MSRTQVASKNDDISVTSIQRQKKSQVLNELIGRKQGGASAKIIEAMFQKPKVADNETDAEEDELSDEDGEMDQNRLEEKLVEEFLNKFIIVSESSTLDHINIVIMLKAIPN